MFLLLPWLCPPARSQSASKLQIVDGGVFREPADLRELFPDPPGLQLGTAALLEYYKGKGVAVAKTGVPKQVCFW